MPTGLASRASGGAGQITKDRGIGGPLLGPSSYFMKSPPEQYRDDECRRLTEEFIAGA